ncbi:hypothetical protein TELCIR_15036 [Teladorsagia circumcincta]|uniref:Uncharacterized protein n=1 Tax=Teladorsagia circumcincta TaxID=45464 RepID=A0A2G9TZH1_TELCI|nr:hypothetical protein TELCIR_15036 [Teladorsagia circumcincta]
MVEQEYSLAKRYQISENIKTCKRFKILVLSVLGFNMICIGAVVIDNFDVTIFIKNMANTVLNYSVLMYGFTMPVVMLFYNELWRKELKRISQKICPGQEDNHPTVNVKSTFGKVMMVNTAEISQRHFDMLRKEWYYSETLKSGI